MLEIGIPKDLIEAIRILNPTLLHKERIYNKIEALKKFGFLDPIKMIVTFPSILNYNIESIGDKIEALKKFGFLDPIKMIVSSPPILSYNIESIGDKIDALKKFGFLDPVKMIVTKPGILSYNIEKNIKPKLVLLIKMI
ncbi:hypothetical protein H7169_00580, partial [Candidatus Gracilibacteria bacterium]|nr:hypothetical protein [Candidatus Gracilibacteria bacterium]